MSGAGARNMDFLYALCSCLVTVVFAYVVIVGLMWATIPPENLPPNMFDMVFAAPGAVPGLQAGPITAE
jgi:hypothetical protein